MAAIAIGSCGAPLLASLYAKHLSLVEIGMFGRMATFGPFQPFLKTHKLPDDALVFGVSPAGDRLLILVDSHRPSRGLDIPKIYDEIDITTLDRKVETRIFPAIHSMLPLAAELSPDGQAVAFTGQFAARDLSRADYGLHLVKVSGETRTLVVTTEPKTPLSIGWSKDGRAIVYDLNGRIRLYHLDTATTSTLVNGSRPVWSQDGKWIAYRRADGGASLIHPDGSGQRNILEHAQSGWGVRWSPDSCCLLYSGFGVRVLEVATGRTATIFTPLYSPVAPGYTEAGLRWVRGTVR
jgi:dipeptidyl aminopeptidase/acylaminoacyl peptidase